MNSIYALKPETEIYKSKNFSKRNIQRKLLMGTFMEILEEGNEWYKIKSFRKTGFVKKSDTSDFDFLKLFFVDVGQGDAILVEAPGKTLIVDGGPSVNLWNYLTKWKYKWIIEQGSRVKIDDIIISHFDADHFKGLTKVINDTNFEIGTIYHNGIVRFNKMKNERLDKYDTDLGATDYKKGVQERSILKTSFNDLDDCLALLQEIPNNKKGLMKSFKVFIEACLKAKDEGRLRKVKRITRRNKYLNGYESGKDFSIQILGPIPTRKTGRVQYKWFGDSTHTINGHSVVLKLNFKGKTALLGGDLNKKSEEHLMANTQNNPFEVDIAKSCHHGASDFSVKFMKKIKPYATVISSGDNESYAHPRADAIGCAGKYSKGEKPLIFSTELARSVNSGRKIHYGLINVRTNGEKFICAQMKESKRSNDIWDAYEI